MVGPVVVGAVGDEYRQAIGVVPGAHEMVAGGFARAVGAAWCVGICFGKGRRAWEQAAIDFVGADVQKAKGGLLWLGECAPVGARRFEQAESAYDVGLDEVFWGADGAVYMAFCRKVQNSARAVFSQQMGNELAIAQVALHKGVARVILQAAQVQDIACIGELVEIDNRLIRLGKPVKHKIAPNKASAACDENHPKPLISNTSIYARPVR